MPTHATFELFEAELNRLVESFGKRLAELKQPGYSEAQLRTQVSRFRPTGAARTLGFKNRTRKVAEFIRKQLD